MSGRILLIEDEPRMVDVVDYALRSAGFDVSSATDGEEALERERAPRRSTSSSSI